MTPWPQPPALARWLVARWFDGEAREVVLGDLAEEFDEQIRAGAGVHRARLRYWRQAVSSVRARRAADQLARSRHHITRKGIMRGLAIDLRFVFRGLRRQPAFAAVAILSLAIGIGANTAIVSVVRSILLTPLPVDRPDELSLVYWARPETLRTRNYSSTGARDPEGRQLHSNYSYPIYRALRDTDTPGVALAGFNFLRSVTINIGDRPPVAAGASLVSGNYFAVLRLGVAHGRPLQESDDVPGAAPVATVTHDFWMRELGGDPAAVGRSLLINGAPFQIVGVTPPDYRGLSPGGFFPPTEITAPLAAQPVLSPSWTPEQGSLFASTDRFWVRLLARRTGGVDPEQAAAPLSATLRGMAVDAGNIDAEDTSAVSVRFLPGARGLDSLRADVERPLFILVGVSGIVLLVACANLAGLMVARGMSRQRELALRRALGASRLRLVRQLLLESGVLAAAGGLAGLLLAVWTGPAIVAAVTAGLGPVAVDVRPDAAMLAITAGVALTAALLSGLIPAIRLSGRDADHLRHRAVGDTAPRLTLGRVLIAVQVATSVPLVVGAGLFLRTVVNLDAVDTGFDPRGIGIFRVDPSLTRTPSESARFYQDLLARLEAVPGMASATLIENALVSGWISNTNVEVDGETGQMYMNAVGPRFIETTGLRLVAGRALGDQDDSSARRVAVINQAAAQRWFPGQAVGRQFVAGGDPVEVVGVVADSTYESLRRPVEPTFYDSYLQRGRGPGAMFVMFRAGVPPASLEPAVRRAVLDIDRQVPVTAFRTQMAQIDETVSRERIFARLLLIFGGFTLLLASIGLHGVTAYSVSRRTNEIGVRLALGAQRAQILWLMLRQVVILTGAGLAVGLVGAWLAGPVIASMLFGVEPGDPVTLAASAGTLFAVAVLAGWLPARRAAAMDALTALGRE